MAKSNGGGARKPDMVFRFGVLRVAVWRQFSEKTGVWYSCRPSRSYQNDQGEWNYTDSYNWSDLLLMAKLLDQAHTWIAEQMAKEWEKKDKAPARKEGHENYETGPAVPEEDIPY